MTTDSAIRPSKRVRFDTSVPELQESPQPVTEFISPTQAAISCLEGHVASLQKTTADIFTKLGTEHIRQLAKIHNKETQVKRMETEEKFVPRSARFQFSLHASKSVAEDAAYPEIEKETIELIEDCQEKLKKQITKVTKLEITYAKKENLAAFAKALRIATQIFLVSINDETDPDQVLSNIFNAHANDILTHHAKDTNAFATAYKECHTLTAWPLPAQPPASSQNASPTPDASLARILIAVFATTWQQFLHQHHQNETTKRLRKMEREIFTEDSTTKANEILDMETTATPELLSELINKTVSQELNKRIRITNDLTKKVKKLTGKNVQQRSSSSASNKNKKETKRKTNETKPNQRDRRGDKSNDTSAASNARTKGKPKKQSKPNVKRSTSKNKRSPRK